MGYKHEINRIAGDAADAAAAKEIAENGIAAASEDTSCQGIGNCWIIWKSAADFIEDTRNQQSSHYGWSIQFHKNVWIEDGSLKVCVGEPSSHNYVVVKNRLEQIHAGEEIANLIRAGLTPSQAFEQWFEEWKGN